MGTPSQPFLAQDSEGPSEPVQDASPVEEVAPVKRKYTKRRQQAKKNDKILNDAWSSDEEIALCKAWVLLKKSRTSETTTHATLDSTHIGLDLNDKAANSEDVEVQDVRRMGQDMSKKKASSSTARSESSAASEVGLVDAFFNKWKQVVSTLFTQWQESSSKYLRLKERELELEDLRRREQAELERLKLAQEERMEQMRLAQQRELEEQRVAHKRQQLQFQRELYEWKKAKMENYLMFYNESHDHLIGKTTREVLGLKATHQGALQFKLLVS
ncbi:hypothetical protein Tco_0115233 [Tanacetum coccineum]